MGILLAFNIHPSSFLGMAIAPYDPAFRLSFWICRSSRAARLANTFNTIVVARGTRSYKPHGVDADSHAAGVTASGPLFGWKVYGCQSQDV